MRRAWYDRPVMDMTEIMIETPRLLLRRLSGADGPDVQRICADKAIADNTASIPHPYPEGEAQRFIEKMQVQGQEGKGSTFAIVIRENGPLVGVIGLTIVPDHQRADLGYWVGVDHWGKGYATEAARAVVRHGFEDLDLQRIHACFFPRNPASGRVLEKLGFVREGRQRQHFVKCGERLDMVSMGMLREEWLAQQEGDA